MNNSEIITGCSRLPDNTELGLDIVKSLLLRKGDSLGLDYIKYRSVVREVYMDLNLHTIRSTTRYFLTVDKNTGTIKLPDTTLWVSSVAILDECGKLIYLNKNDDLLYDIVDVGAVVGCGCDCGCKGSICHSIKSYEPIMEMVTETMPNNSTKVFECVTRKRVDTDGTVYIEKTFPVRKYTGQTWTDTVLETEVQKICAVEVAGECGCIKESEANKKALLSSCHAETLEDECGRCSRVPVEYNITKEGDRLILPSTCRYDKLLVRIYEDAPIEELRVPRFAKKAFLYGLADAVALFDDSENKYRIEKYEQRYGRERSKLLDILARMTISAMYQVLSPKRPML